MMRFSRVWGGLAALLMVLACADPTAVSDGVLTAQHRNGQLELHNASNTPVHYFALERQAVAYVDWIACVHAACPAAAAGARVSVPDATLPGFTSEAREALVYWWRAVSDGNGGMRPDSIRFLVVPLR